MARDKMITIRVDEAEHALFKGAAAAVPVSISEYARDAMLARMALEEVPTAGVGVLPDSPAPGVAAQVPPQSPQVIRSPAEVPGAVERAARSANPAPRPFTPYSKEAQTGRAKKLRAEVAAARCRHGLVRCKICGTL